MGLVLKQGSRFLLRISGFTVPLSRWHSAQLNPEGLSSLVDIRALGKASSYGYEHRLPQHFCRLNFHGGNVSNLQNEFVQDKSGELQIANHVSCVPRHYGTGRGQLPALRKAVARGMNRCGALPCLASTTCAGPPCA
jgi:hypothetical protein